MSSKSSPTSLEQLRNAILHSPELQRRLCEVSERSEFISKMVEIAEGMGMPITTAEMDTASISGYDQLTEPAPSELRDWVPMQVSRRGKQFVVDWCYVGQTRFTRPFFEDTIRERFGWPFSRTFRHKTSIECVGELVNASPGIPPTGFIFHMSRCGSTLVSQMLASIGKNVVMSEPLAVDGVMSLRGKDEFRIEWVKWLIAALGQKRFDDEQHFYIKFDSWTTLDMDVITRAFPAVPWIFLYRDPIEVIASHMRRRGSQMIPGTMERILPGVDVDEALAMGVEEYCARVLGTICEAAARHADSGNGMLVNYSELPESVTTDMLDHFGVKYAVGEIERMQAQAKFDAKSPRMFFEPDGAGKQTEATDAARSAAAQYVDPHYSRLEEMRLKRS